LPTLETVSLDDYGIGRQPNEPLSIWYGQPVLDLPGEPPFIPKPGPYATGLQVLQGILEHGDFRNSECKPAIVVLPELAVPFKDIGTARTLIAKAPKGTLAVFGAGHMTAEEALSLEAKPELWDGEAAGRFANCAVVGVGGSDQVFLQPKLLKSASEKDWHWPGRVVRCFVGQYFRFSTFICSDLLNRPGNSSYMAWLYDQLEKKQEKLSLALWLQHNSKPRSDQFSNAIETVARMGSTTVVVAGSRMPEGGKRFENFAVCGAFARRTLFPSEFDKFTHRFHYAEPACAEVSRAVLLRYDADAYRVRTVLADSLDATNKVEKGEFFDSSQPYTFQNAVLTTSSENNHIRDLCEPARLAARKEIPALSAEIDSVVSALSGMATSPFLSFLDLGIVPQTPEGENPHLAGQKHDGGDLRCRCWKHRSCIDLLTEPDGMIPLAAIIEILGVFEHGGCAPKPRCDMNTRTNVDVTISDARSPVVVIYPQSLDFEALQKKVFGEKPPVLKRRFIFVTDPAHSRPPVDTINAAKVSPQGAIDAGKASSPTFSEVKGSELKRAHQTGDLNAYLERLFKSE
jgi:hypothetical protein